MKVLSLDNDNNIYILNELNSVNERKKIFIEVMRMENNYFKLIKKYNEAYINDSQALEMVLMNKNKNNLMLWGNSTYLLCNF